MDEMSKAALVKAAMEFQVVCDSAPEAREYDADFGMTWKVAEVAVVAGVEVATLIAVGRDGYHHAMFAMERDGLPVLASDHEFLNAEEFVANV